MFAHNNRPGKGDDTESEAAPDRGRSLMSINSLLQRGFVKKLIVAYYSKLKKCVAKPSVQPARQAYRSPHPLCSTYFRQIFSIGNHTGVDYQSDIRFVIAQGTCYDKRFLKRLAENWPFNDNAWRRTAPHEQVLYEIIPNCRYEHSKRLSRSLVGSYGRKQVTQNMGFATALATSTCRQPLSII